MKVAARTRDTSLQWSHLKATKYWCSIQHIFWGETWKPGNVYYIPTYAQI